MTGAPLSIVYFAWVRERIGIDGETIARPATGTSIAQLIEHLAGRSEAHAAAFVDRSRLRAALDQRFVSMDTHIDDARELALFPPVTGG